MWRVPEVDVEGAGGDVAGRRVKWAARAVDVERCGGGCGGQRRCMWMCCGGMIRDWWWMWWVPEVVVCGAERVVCGCGGLCSWSERRCVFVLGGYDVWWRGFAEVAWRLR